MRTLVVCASDSETAGRSLTHARVSIDGQPRTFTLVECADEAFDSDASDNRSHVLMRVRGFSLNFRDRVMLNTAAAATRGIGSEFVGEIVAAGPGMDRLVVGQRVIGEMAYPGNGVAGVPGGVVTNAASRELQRVHASKLMPVPPSMPDEVAASFALGAQTAYGMVRRLDVRRGDNVLLTAATSNTSLFGLQALVQRGARVVALTRSRRWQTELECLGAAQVIGVESADDLSAVREVARTLGGFDAVFDPFSDVYFPSVLSFMGLGARYITCGVADQRWVVDDEDVEAMSQWKHVAKALIVKNVTLMGNCLGTTHDLADALADWCAGRLQVVLDSVHTDGAVGPFLERTFSASDRFGKAVYLY